MHIKRAEKRSYELINELLAVWEASVRETHHFLTDADIRSIKPQVQQALTVIPELLYIAERGKILGFMGIEKQKIEMLFIHPTYRGHGIGKQFISNAINFFAVSLVDVNEQNVQAFGFYSHMGFKVIDRSPTDESGNPFPILHMHR